MWKIDQDAARTALEQIAAQVLVPAKDARLDFVRRTLEPDVTGRALDVEVTLAQLVRQVRAGADASPLVFDELEPTVSLADLPPVDPRKLLAMFETDFSKKRGPRVHNIRRAASYLNGSVVNPGATLSFNARVGQRVGSRGFIDAPVIINDEMESGMGGGVCQVATTLHAAAVYGGLEVKERRSHSRPSGYAPLGLDATVIDDVQDLKIVNPYPVPLYIRAYLPSRYVIRVEILGAELDGTVKHSYWVLERHAFTRRIVEKPELAPGTYKVSQKGNFGYDTLSSVIQTRVDGQRKERRFKSKYYPVPEVLWIGPGTRGADLPPLPEAAVGFENAAAL
jgi:vancomycin resistance protein YoaR